MNETPLWKRCLTEIANTYCLVLLGCGAMAVESRTGVLTHPGVALTWGLVVLVMIFATGRISGAHMNPAVTIVFAVIGRLSWRDVFGYIVAQCVGATLGAASIRMVLGVDDALLGATVTELPNVPALAVEFMITAILMFVVMGVSTGAKEETITAALAVGATIAMEAMVAGPLTKASMNPARSFGPAVVSGATDQLWIYIVAPVVGAIVGAWVYQVVQAHAQAQTDALSDSPPESTE